MATMVTLQSSLRGLRDAIPILDRSIVRIRAGIPTLLDEGEVEVSKGMLIKMETTKEYSHMVLGGFTLIIAKDMQDTTGTHRIPFDKMVMMNRIVVELTAMCMLKDLNTNIYTLRHRIPNLDKCIDKQNEHIQTLDEETTPERERKLHKAMLIKMDIIKEFSQSILSGFSVMCAQDMADTTGAHRLTSAKIAQMNRILAQVIAMCTVTHEEWNRKIADARKRLEADPDACIWSEIFGRAVILGLMGGPCTTALMESM